MVTMKKPNHISWKYVFVRAYAVTHVYFEKIQVCAREMLGVKYVFQIPNTINSRLGYAIIAHVLLACVYGLIAALSSQVDQNTLWA